MHLYPRLAAGAITSRPCGSASARLVYHSAHRWPAHCLLPAAFCARALPHGRATAARFLAEPIAAAHTSTVSDTITYSFSISFADAAAKPSSMGRGHVV